MESIASLACTLVMVAATLTVTLVPLMILLPIMMYRAIQQHRRRMEAWATVGQELGAPPTPSGEIAGVLKGRGFRVCTRTEGSGKNSRVYTDVLVKGATPHLELHRQALLVFGTDHRVGEQSFDDAFQVGGDAAAIGVLDEATRRLLLRSPYAVKLSGGLVRVSAPGVTADAEALRTHIQWAFAVAEALSADDTALAEQLRDGVAQDPVPQVRGAFLEALQTSFPAAFARPAAIGALEDPDPGVRVAAAGYLGRDDVLFDVLGEANVDDEVRIEALGALTDEGVDRGVSVASKVPEAERVWRAAALVAEERGGVGACRAFAELAPVLERWPSGGEIRARRIAAARAIARCLHALGHPEGEPALMALVGADDGETRRLAVAGLGAVGSVAAVPALQRIVDSAGVLSSDGVDAKKAIRAIQRRAGGQRGGLALAASAGGDLAVAEGERPARASQAAARRTIPEG